MDDRFSEGAVALQLPRDGSLEAPFDAALAYAFGVLSPDEVAKMSVCVYDFPASGYRKCDADCPVEAAGTHSLEVMRDWLALSRYGINSHVPAIDGLSTATIAAIKAHAVSQNGESNFPTFQVGRMLPGQPDSFGAVLCEVQLPPEGNDFPVFRFIVSASGANKIDDHFVSVTVGDRLVREMLFGGVLPVAARTSETFIVGVPLAEAKAYAEAHRTV